MTLSFNCELEGFLQFMKQIDRDYIGGASFSEICQKYELSQEQFNALLDRYVVHPNASRALEECELFSSIVPVFLSKKGSESVNHFASGVLLRLPYSTYLLTAAHVTDEWRDGHLIIPGEKELIGITGEHIYWKPSQGESRGTDKIDIALIRLSRNTRSRIHSSFRELTLADISYKGSVATIPFATFSGYPVTKSRKWNGVHSNEIVTYTGHVWSKDVYERLGYIQDRHICIRMRIKETFSSSHGRKLISPYPTGISGGAIFSWPYHLKDRQNANGLRLIGIAHTFDRAANCLVGTHIQMYINAIVHNNPKMRPAIKRAIDKTARMPLV